MRAAAIFPGQGSQSVGMGGAIAQRYPAVADLFARAERILGYDLLAIVRDGPDERLRETQYAQPAIFVTNYALAIAAGDVPVVVSAGHSFAEFCSLTLAGAVDFDTALALVAQRGLAMQDAAAREPGAMAAVLGLDPDRLRDAVERAHDAGRVRLANFNAPGQIVISGDEAAVLRAGELATQAGAKRVVRLNVSGAWHSELMEPARERFAPYVRRAELRLPRFEVISNVDARPYRDVETIRTNLIASVTGEVLWHAAAEALVAREPDLVIEFGGSPPVLTPMIKRVAGAPRAVAAGDENGLDALAAAVAETVRA